MFVKQCKAQWRIIVIEKFQIPGVAAIIERNIGGKKHILIQERVTPNRPEESGLLEISAGKIRQFENLFDTLRREVKEETGLTVTSITEEANSQQLNMPNYQVVSCEPYCIGQNISGNYPILVITFLCKATGTLLKQSDETKNIRWIAIKQLAEIISDTPEKLYPMHIYTRCIFMH